MFKKLNEQLEKFIIDELSYETKKSYLAKKQAQLDKARRAMEKAQRLVRDTEANKQGKRRITIDQIKQLMNNIEKEFPKYNGRYFYGKTYGTWGELAAGDVSENDNSCRIILSFDDQYLFIRIETCKKVSNGLDKKIKEKFSLDDFNFFKLNNKVLAFVKNFMKSVDKEANSKANGKLEKASETLKKLLSKVKADKLDPENNKFDQKVAYNLTFSNVREFYPAVMSVKGVTIPSTLGYENDYQIKGIGLTKKLTIGLFYWTERYTRIDHCSLEDIKATTEDKLIAVNKLIDILKGVSGRSTIKSDAKKLEAKKELAKKAADEFRSLIRAENGGQVESPKENGMSYEIFTQDWGEWGTSDDWEEDNDFMKPTKETYEDADNVCKDMKKRYPDLKFTYGVSEKRMLSFYVEY